VPRRAGVKEARIRQIAIALLVRNWKFESTPLQQRVRKLSVPERRNYVPSKHLDVSASPTAAWTSPRTRGVPRDEVVAEQKIVYLRNVGQGSSSLEGEACSTLTMSSQRRLGTAPR
jgi:hypothetical protein